MCYICTDEHKMWPQHSVRKWEVRKANMTGNNLLQKNQTKPDDLSNRFIIFCMPKRLQSSSRLEIHRKNNEAKLVLHVLNRNTCNYMPFIFTYWMPISNIGDLSALRKVKARRSLHCSLKNKLVKSSGCSPFDVISVGQKSGGLSWPGSEIPTTLLKKLVSTKKKGHSFYLDGRKRISFYIFHTIDLRGNEPCHHPSILLCLVHSVDWNASEFSEGGQVLSWKDRHEMCP